MESTIKKKTGEKTKKVKKMTIKMKLKNCMVLFLISFIVSTIAWYIVPFVDFDNELFLIGSIGSITGLVFSLFMIPQMRKALLKKTYFEVFCFLSGCFSISLGAWFLVLAMTPDNVPFLIGSISSSVGVITTLWLIYEFVYADRKGIKLFKINAQE